MRHFKALAWEKKLKEVFDEIDALLEKEYGSDYTLHPSRPEEGVTSNPEQDGLFSVGGVFTAGYGSAHGRGYVVQLHMSTLSAVPPAVRDEIQQRVHTVLEEKLAVAFPGRRLTVEEDGRVLKIIGDLSLGEV